MPQIAFNKNIYVVEGFDMVGKTSFIKKYMSRYNYYRPTYEMYDISVGRKDSWLASCTVIDYLKNMEKPTKTVIDRGLFSGQVYSRIYNNKFLDNKILDFFKKDNYFCKEVGHVYLRHRDVNTAREIFESAKKREVENNEITKSLDNFRTFDYYWTYYTNADLMFNDMYKQFGIEPRVFEIDIQNNDFIEIV